MSTYQIYKTAEEIPPTRGKDEPDYERMIGYLRAIWLSYRLNLPHLRQVALDAIAKNANQAGGES